MVTTVSAMRIAPSAVASRASLKQAPTRAQRATPTSAILRRDSKSSVTSSSTSTSLSAAGLRASAASSCSRRGLSRTAAAPVVVAASSPQNLEVEDVEVKRSVDVGRLALLATVASTPILFGCQEAFAKGGEFGHLEGTTAALVHPFFLAGLWFSTVYAGYLGWQWRRVRTTGEEITALKATLKATMPAVAVAATDGAAAAIEFTPAQQETQSRIAELSATRKELAAGGFKDKHYNVGALLLSFGTILAVDGAMNTYLRTGKLFPGPHLYAGLGIVCLWAGAAALVPEMQRGNNAARNTHIALNAVNLGLFTWQIPTGLAIVDKVFQFTSWP